MSTAKWRAANAQSVELVRAETMQHGGDFEELL
jgi:hypothetical protein